MMSLLPSERQHSKLVRHVWCSFVEKSEPHHPIVVDGESNPFSGFNGKIARSLQILISCLFELWNSTIWGDFLLPFHFSYTRCLPFPSLLPLFAPLSAPEECLFPTRPCWWTSSTSSFPLWASRSRAVGQALFIVMSRNSGPVGEESRRLCWAGWCCRCSGDR